MYDELPLSQIALQLGYRSTARLSTQFKKLTGFTVHNSNKWEDKAGNH
jgi:AraC-like DNA-binding protein